jgi:HAMP domain-containing protein
MIASKTIRPLLELKSIADDISRGQLDTPVSFQSNDEIGELARSLERMRASLKAAGLSQPGLRRSIWGLKQRD